MRLKLVAGCWGGRSAGTAFAGLVPRLVRKADRCSTRPRPKPERPPHEQRADDGVIGPSGWRGCAAFGDSGHAGPADPDGGAAQLSPAGFLVLSVGAAVPDHPAAGAVGSLDPHGAG